MASIQPGFLVTKSQKAKREEKARFTTLPEGKIKKEGKTKNLLSEKGCLKCLCGAYRNSVMNGFYLMAHIAVALGQFISV